VAETTPTPDAPAPAGDSGADPAPADDAFVRGAGHGTPLFEGAFLRALERLSIVSRKIFSGRMRGERRSKQRGVSIEFADYREYVLGDDPRFIDWNVYGRLDRLFLKLFQEEEDLSVSLLVDTSLSMDFGTPLTKLRWAAKVAGALGYIAISNQDRVTAAALGKGISGMLPSARGRRDVYRLFKFFEELRPSGGTDLTAACKQFSLRHRQKGLVVLISDFLDPKGYEEAVRALVGRRNEVICIQVLSREEMQPPLSGDLRLTDVESDTVQDITMSVDLRDAYDRHLRAFTGGFRAFCMKRGATPLFGVTDEPADELIHRSLRALGVLQ
jgi:uncharacterized protein (DUF58 family)